MPTIRPYQPKDKENVRHVCTQTGPSAALREGPARTAQLATYCDYYIEREAQNCFVIAGGGDEAVGYILCAENYRRYRARFMREYLPRVKGLRLRLECWGAAWLPRWYAKKYPAHLHIDILPDYQRQGLGSQLMDALTARLRARGVPGVMLGVSAGNEKGRNFYKKYGFRQIGRAPGCVVMGLELK